MQAHNTVQIMNLWMIKSNADASGAIIAPQLSVDVGDYCIFCLRRSCFELELVACSDLQWDTCFTASATLHARSTSLLNSQLRSVYSLL